MLFLKRLDSYHGGSNYNGGSRCGYNGGPVEATAGEGLQVTVNLARTTMVAAVAPTMEVAPDITKVELEVTTTVETLVIEEVVVVLTMEETEGPTMV
ncbi:unnamed protein product [Orchesella dallaii]|uniref:Uncharacterized protein n=1 Tax=Orchesella dallaii TaxID=48710 RepID=A0ABP1PVQ7_9HEXA